MATWKELGEVPDSEEEDGFDSQDAVAPIQSTTTTTRTTTSTNSTTSPRICNEEKDVWDFPDSGEQLNHDAKTDDPSSPIASSTPTGFDPLDNSSPLSVLDNEPDRQISLEDENIPKASPRKTESNLGPFPKDEPIVSPQIEGPNVRLRVSTHHLDDHVLMPDQQAQQASFRYERSLRPRKPIQEHPYLLENAQYSTFLRERGVRPLKMATEPRAIRKDKSSHDEDFERESQEEILPEEVMPEETDENQMIDAHLSLKKPDLFLSSSPLRTPPLSNHERTSSLPFSQETCDTSIMDRDLPDLQQLLQPRSQLKTSNSTPLKRKASQSQSAAQKRKRQDMVLSDVEKGLPDLSMPILGAICQELTSHRRLDTEKSISPHVEPLELAPKLRTPIIEIQSEDEEDEQGNHTLTGQDTIDTQSESENDHLVTKIGKRIRGVLPASWLRLDQQSSRAKAQQDVHQRQQHRILHRQTKRGVARPRVNASGPSSARYFLDEFQENEEEEADQTSILQHQTTDDVFHNQTRLSFGPLEDTNLPEPSFSEDSDSMMEDNSIDLMTTGRKRQLKLSAAYNENSKRAKKPVTRGVHLPSRKSRQLQLTGLLQNPNSSGSVQKQKKSRNSPGGRRPKRIQGQGAENSRIRRSLPPRLSILDVIEPNAPRFLRISARTAKRQTSQGRSSPHSKSIKLATRQDNIDAVSVLQYWRLGSIKQRPSVTTSCQSYQRQPRPSQPHSVEASANRVAEVSSPTAQQRKTLTLENHVSQRGAVSYKPNDSVSISAIQNETPATKDGRHLSMGSARPAQLEVSETPQSRSLKFLFLKKVLDRQYGERDRSVPGPGSMRCREIELAMQTRVASPEVEQLKHPHRNSVQENGPLKRSRLRKMTKPHQINIEAPHFAHADDPLPMQYLPCLETSETQPHGSKVSGLGPYGTRYTHHFETFPLDSRVYFHDSTLLGSGAIDDCLSDGLCSRLKTPRPRVSFDLGEQVLRWGPWDDLVSSELGIVVDYVADEVEKNLGGHEARSRQLLVAADATGFMLKYVGAALSVDEDSTMVSFVSRFQKALASFCERIRPHIKQSCPTQPANHEPLLRILDRLLLLSFLLLRICRLDASLIQQQFHLEDTLKSIAGMSLSLLVGSGMNRLTAIYQELARSSYRERGLRDDAPEMHSWTLLMRILGLAQIPRSSFWDLFEATIDLPQAISGFDIQDFERVWQMMFNLLPLTDFNNCGVIAQGKQHDIALDGWSIPQKLLKRVFELYQANDRQAPSFNNYCRALVGRCHYLLRQWKWRRSAPIIGVIFDFFGSQDLAHLRNEEVYKSPQFLEELAQNPSLDVQPEDRCFHIFLKLLALSICDLGRLGSEKDIRNLVARTIPNHNRQFLKEQNVRERDLAALRNHHDLIATLYWACPSKLRPPATLIERLVTPETSHKEACLINIRAWSQLARFIVASGEATNLPKNFGQWRNSFFSKMLQQFESVASDIKQQLSSLSADASKFISKDMVNSMMSLNKAAVEDVLIASAAASLDVMRLAPDLEAATFCLSTPQLQQIFNYFSSSPPELSWSILRVALATLDSLLSKIEEFKDNEESQQNESQILNSAQADDALMAIDNDLSRSFFLMARTILSVPEDSEIKFSASSTLDRHRCVEETLSLSARIGTRFMNGGLMRISDMFRSSKHGLFNGFPATLDLRQRKYLPLFILNLLKQGFDGFTDAQLSLTEIWALSLVKPRGCLEYENQLAEQLQRRGKEFVPEAIVGISIQPDYNSNRDLFEFAVSFMRKSIRSAGPSLKKILMKEYSGILGSVMMQIQGDLKFISQDGSEHHHYVMFVQDIISLIKVHGSEMCTVDEFFYKISKEYSPSTQDPQLQVAGIISYGFRLQEGDMGAAHQLFYLLFANFKFALTSDKLDEDVNMLEKGLKHQAIFFFILEKMLPAVIRAACSCDFAFVLLDVYVEALGRYMTETALAREIKEEDLPRVAAVLRAAIDGMNTMSRRGEILPGPQVHVLRQTITILNLLWPSLSILPLSRCRVMQDSLDILAAFAMFAQDYLTCLLEKRLEVVEASLLFEGVEARLGPVQFDAHVDSFTKEIVDDIAKNWIVSRSKIAISAPGQLRGTQGKDQGVERPMWNCVEPGAIPCRNLVIHGTEATGKSSITEKLLVRLTEHLAEQGRGQALLYASVNAAQCITGRHLFERIIGAVADSIRRWDGEVSQPRRCETLAQLSVALSGMLQPRSSQADWRFVLVLDAIDKQREGPPTLMPALARLSEIIPCLTCVFIVTAPPAGFLRTPLSPYLHFPPYTKSEFVRILSLNPPPPIFSPPTDEEEKMEEVATQNETSDLWVRFCAAVYDSLVKSASGMLPSFQRSCHTLWPRFTAPIVARTHSPKDFSKLLIAARAHFQDETLLNPSIISVRAADVETTPSLPKSSTESAAGLTTLLPTAARLLLLSAYLASHNATRHDLTLFSTYYHGRKRRRGGSLAMGRRNARSKHRKIARKLLGAHAFVFERMMAIFEAVRTEWVGARSVVGAAGLDGDVGMAMATLSSLRLLIKVGAGDVMDRAGKWRINVEWEAIRGIGRSIGVDIEEWLIE